MSPKEMVLACQLSLSSGVGRVTFIVPGCPNKRGIIRLDGNKSPKGEVVCVNSDKETVASFDAVDVLAWMAANGLVELTIKPS